VVGGFERGAPTAFGGGQGFAGVGAEIGEPIVGDLAA
jgi:hypothetical protein